ncbi:MAG: hypothetical protein WCG73_01325 [Candidatus Moraniibacteriota bacterium]
MSKDRRDSILEYLGTNPRSDILQITNAVKIAVSRGLLSEVITQAIIEQDMYQLGPVQGLVKNVKDQLRVVYSLSELGKKMVSLTRSRVAPRRMPLPSGQRATAA